MSHGRDGKRQKCAAVGCTNFVHYVPPSKRAKGWGLFCSKSCAMKEAWDATKGQAQREGIAFGLAYMRLRGPDHKGAREARTPPGET